MEVEIEGGEKSVRRIPDFKLWSPESPNLTTITVDGRKVRFGIRQIEAKKGKIYLNGRPIFLKGFNRHESSNLERAATTESTMLRDIMETLWDNPDCSGFCIWQMNDGRTRERFDDRTTPAMFGGSIAGCYDQMRRPKMSVKTIREFFNRK